VKPGDLLFRLDSRGIEAQIRQQEAALSRSRAQLDQAQRDVKRQEQLAANEFASKQRLDDARTTVETLSAQIRGDEAALDNLKVQLSYYTIRAPSGGRAGVAGLKAGNIAKTGDASGALVTIVQVTPIYVAFSVPQRLLPEIRTAMADGTAKVTATPQGSAESLEGKIAVIDNTVDPQSGTITLRAIFDNPKDLLWPGALCNVRVILRTEPEAVSIPTEAVQSGQSGNYVFVVADGTARVRPVTVARSVDGRAVIGTGLDGSETVVTDGHLLLNEGSKVEIRQRPGPGKAPAPPSGGKPPATGADSSASPRSPG
jgi:RND family efflux transporter MFP subunit